MTLSPRLELRQQQRLSLTPDLRLRLSMLRMTPAELDETLAREAQDNPFLRYRARAGLVLAMAGDEALTAEIPSLLQSLGAQIGLMTLPASVAGLARALAGEIDDDGFLRLDLAEFARRAGAGPALVEAALDALHSCDPPGIAARDVAECLRLQLQDRGLDSAAAAATVAQLPALARQDWAAAGAALGLDEGATRARAAMLRGLTPRPALAPSAPVATLEPDLRLVRGADGRASVVCDMRTRPRLSLDAEMARSARDRGFGAELLARAQAVVLALDHRAGTLARIGAWIETAQAAFFRQGLGGLAPASQRDLAAALGLHPSTVSRALAGKAIDVDGRLWPLSVFFSRALPEGGGEVSARALQARIAALIRAEPAGAPLSDAELCEKLHEQGVDIARRTVAKYRQGLRIPPSSTRRRLAATRPRAGSGA